MNPIIQAPGSGLDEEALAQAIVRALKSAGSAEVPVEVAVPIGFFLTVVASIVTVLAFRDRRERLRHATIRSAIERGVDIPAELLFSTNHQRSDLRRGIVLLFGGFGFSLLMLAQEGFSAGSWGFGSFPMMLGAGYLLSWRLGRLGIR